MGYITARAIVLKRQLGLLVQQELREYVTGGVTPYRRVAAFTGLSLTTVAQIISGKQRAGLTTLCRLCVSTPRVRRAVIDLLAYLDHEDRRLGA